jgi:hypothetical protein
MALGLSLLVHLALLFPFADYGRYYFARPVTAADAVFVQIVPGKEVPAQRSPAVLKKTVAPGAREKGSRVAAPAEESSDASRNKQTESDAAPAEPASVQTVAPVEVTPAIAANQKATLPAPPPSLRTAAEFTTTQREQLNYRISLMGMPVGIAELEAKNVKGEINISLKVKSTPAISAVYPVDDLIETRHIAGNFIITKIRQQEGSFKSHRGFTLFLRDKSVFWMDLLRNRTSRETIPNSEVLDLMSAFYYLRNRPLRVGTIEELHVYDSDTYTRVPVEVLRREETALPAFRHANTIVIKPFLKTDGIFKRTGEVTIWLTDDEYHVPVRLETSIPLGKITAELVSSQVDKLEPAKPMPPLSPQKR